MIRGYAVAQVRAAEDAVRAGLPEGELMQRAARGLAQVVAARAAQHDRRRVVVLAGPGDNGGDALHAAALLALEHGDRLTVVVLGGTEQLHEGGLAAAQAAGVPVVGIATRRVEGRLALGDEPVALLAEADLVVDGLLGIGGRPGLRGPMAALVDAIPDDAYLVAVDLPSGADPAGVQPVADAVFADETVTFAMAKPVHLMPATEPAVGLLTVVDIGVREPDEPAEVERLGHDDVAELWPVPGAGDDKYSRGVLGIVAGSDTYPGAAVLCTTAAVEAGVGMVRYVGPAAATSAVLAACPEVVTGTGRVQAWVVGPGLSLDESPEGRRQAAAARAALEQDVPVLVDAGGLDLLDATVLESRRGVATLLTPHAGEAARLLSRLVDGRVFAPAQVQARPELHARQLAEVTGCTVLLKGAITLVVPPDGVPVRAQADGPPWLATAGAGDVLAGVAGVLLAGGLDPLDAGSVAALVHGLSADRANPGGPVRALAVARALPATVASLLTARR